MELIHIANATFSSSRIRKNHSLEKLASKNKTYRIVKEHAMRLAARRDQARPPLGTGSRHRAGFAFSGRRVVEPAGIEPATFWLQTRRSPS
jgi:hypothetical protein